MIGSVVIEEGALMNIEEDYYNRLFNGRLCPKPKDNESKRARKELPFQTMWELFVYATILGIKEGRVKKIEKQHKPFRWGNIGHLHQKNLLLLVTAKNGSLEFLKDGSNVKKTIEEYANCGFSIINQEIKNNPSAFSNLEELTYRLMELTSL